MHPYEIVLQTQLSSVCWNDLFFFLHFLLTIKCQGERGKRGAGEGAGEGEAMGSGLRASRRACWSFAARSCRRWTQAARRCWHAVCQVSCHRSLHTPLHKVSMGLTLVRSHRMPLPLSRASTTSLFALSTMPEPIGQPARRNSG